MRAAVRDWARQFPMFVRAVRAIRRQRDIRLIAASGIFLADWYLEQNPEARNESASPLMHYVDHGARQGRDPSPLFDTAWYLAENPDVLASGINPLVHYLRTGAREQCDPSAVFNTPAYVRQKPDLQKAGGNPLIHYLRYGAAAGLDPNPLFDSNWYVAHNPDLGGLNPLVHYLWRGAAEGREPGPLFDSVAYARENPDLGASGSNPLVHYLKSGYAPRHVGGDVDSPPVPLIEAAPLAASIAKIIAFYLPQFHPIPENDAWWGKGFTEWTNVIRGKPLFAGHHQPHLPGELGFYDLRIPDVQRRQVELAKLYGIAGFCFYFYWFDGKRLLEMPLQQYLEHTEFNLPFCLCWANENWTRRWDGMEHHLLIKQNHSTRDDVAFMAHVARYFGDSRYLHLDGKPILLVYRPDLFPSMRDTASRWRDWCRANGIGEIFLAYVQSFDRVDPSLYGFDAAIEFPPVTNPPPEIGDAVELTNKSFRGHLLDGRWLVQQSDHYVAPDYPLFRGVCPSWDNEARRPGRSHILYGTSPAGYLRWLENAVLDTVARTADPDARLVFANAWNEWAEGCHLEPDRKHGYAYLEATRMALVRAGLRTANRADRQCSGPATALGIVIHAFHPDIFEDLALRLDRLASPCKVFVTAPVEAIGRVRAILKTKTFSHELIEVENRGRDVAPFLFVVRQAIADGCDIILKLHTKKSVAGSPSEKWGSGDEWREGLYRCLADPGQIEWIIAQLRMQQEIGIVASDQHLAPLAHFWGQNQPRVEWLARRMGIDVIDPAKDLFPAGTMFFARAAALQPLLNIAINRDDFEPERGQRDGTMAHAIERVIGFCARAAGLTVASARVTNIKSEQILVRAG